MVCYLALALRLVRQISHQHSVTPTSHIRHLCFHPAVSEISWRARYARQASDPRRRPRPAVDMRTFQDYALYKWLRTRLQDHPCAAAAWPVITTNEIRDIPPTTPSAISLCTRHATRSLPDRWRLITDRKYTQVSKHSNIHCYTPSYVD